MKSSIENETIWYVVDSDGCELGPFSTMLMIYQYNYAVISPTTYIRSSTQNKTIRFSDSILASDKYSKNRNDSIHGNRCAFYILHDSSSKNLPTKLGISENPIRRCHEHRKHTNINYQIVETFWLPNKKTAEKIEKKVISQLHREGIKRVGNEFFSISPSAIKDAFLKCAYC